MSSELSQEDLIAQMLSPDNCESSTATGEGRWLRTDEYVEGVRALQMARMCLRLARKDVYHWKWVLISVHSAVQAYMVIALKGTAGFDVMTSKSVSKWLETHYRSDDEERRYPELRMDTFLNMFEKVRIAWVRDVTGGCPESVSDAIKKIHEEFRNKFVHFYSQSWNIEVSGMPGILLSCLEVVEFCGWHCADSTWYSEQTKANAMAELARLRRGLRAMQKVYS